MSTAARAPRVPVRLPQHQRRVDRPVAVIQLVQLQGEPQLVLEPALRDIVAHAQVLDRVVRREMIACRRIRQVIVTRGAIEVIRLPVAAADRPVEAVASGPADDPG